MEARHKIAQQLVPQLRRQFRLAVSANDPRVQQEDTHLVTLLLANLVDQLELLLSGGHNNEAIAAQVVDLFLERLRGAELLGEGSLGLLWEGDDRPFEPHQVILDLPRLPGPGGRCPRAEGDDEAVWQGLHHLDVKPGELPVGFGQFLLHGLQGLFALVFVGLLAQIVNPCRFLLILHAEAEAGRQLDVYVPDAASQADLGALFHLSHELSDICWHRDPGVVVVVVAEELLACCHEVEGPPRHHATMSYPRLQSGAHAEPGRFQPLAAEQKCGRRQRARRQSGCGEERGGSAQGRRPSCSERPSSAQQLRGRVATDANA
mmetsp:Transcript_99149/g.285158  ORF Transcript_99149/g.285158 Transcript_99149/m.285158 type:complete len:319 (-) Transcript_99149:90-1046(-)